MKEEAFLGGFLLKWSRTLWFISPMSSTCLLCVEKLAKDVV